MSRILVTGGFGFVGSYLLAPLAEQGHEVLLLTRSSSKDRRTNQFHTVTVDEVESDADELKIDVVINLAGKYAFNHMAIGIRPLIESNLELPVRLATALSLTKRSVRWIQASTFMQHRDSLHRNPSCFYASTKQSAEDFLGYFSDDQFQIITLVLPHIYGEGDTRPKLINLLLAAAKSHDEIQLSSGRQVMDLVHVSDVVKAICTAISPEISIGRWQVSSGQKVLISEIVEFIDRQSRGGICANFDPAKDRLTDCYDLWIGAPPLPGWSPGVDLFEWLQHELSSGL